MIKDTKGIENLSEKGRKQGDTQGFLEDTL